MNEKKISFFPYGKNAILISCRTEISEALLNWLLMVKEWIEKERSREIVEVITAYDSLLVRYKKPVANMDKEIDGLKSMIRKSQPSATFKSRLFHIPVCYDEKFGLDIKTLASKKNLDPQSIPLLHSAPLYLVYFIGFLPGFPYLGQLPEALVCPRRDDPRKKIPQGAVGIGGRQTGIYPGASPGGWQLIGHCPVRIFDPQSELPCLFKPGDRIKFYPVSIEEHEEITASVNAGNFKVTTESYDAKST